MVSVELLLYCGRELSLIFVTCCIFAVLVVRVRMVEDDAQIWSYYFA